MDYRTTPRVPVMVKIRNLYSLFPCLTVLSQHRFQFEIYIDRFWQARSARGGSILTLLSLTEGRRGRVSEAAGRDGVGSPFSQLLYKCCKDCINIFLSWGGVVDAGAACGEWRNYNKHSFHISPIGLRHGSPFQLIRSVIAVINTPARPISWSKRAPGTEIYHAVCEHRVSHIAELNKSCRWGLNCNNIKLDITQHSDERAANFHPVIWAHNRICRNLLKIYISSNREIYIRQHTVTKRNKFFFTKKFWTK